MTAETMSDGRRFGRAAWSQCWQRSFCPRWRTTRCCSPRWHCSRRSCIRSGPSLCCRSSSSPPISCSRRSPGRSRTPCPRGASCSSRTGSSSREPLGICLGTNPFLAYGLVGVGAATYSPAKYGILSELTSADQLVKANGLIESSTIAAILIGAVAGGTLADWDVRGALAAVAACYALAALANLLIPKVARPRIPCRAIPSCVHPARFRTRAAQALLGERCALLRSSARACSGVRARPCGSC